MDELKHPIKIVVPGNHDVWCMHNLETAKAAFQQAGIHFLVDSEMRLPNGDLVYGVPWTPDFYPQVWAFNYCQTDRDPYLIWEAVPDKVDVLITHGPPYGCRDFLKGKGNLGCKELAERIRHLDPKLHVFGHIHDGYGEAWYDHENAIYGKPVCRMVNASICTEEYKPTNPPVVFDLP